MVTHQPCTCIARFCFKSFSGSDFFYRDWVFLDEGEFRLYPPICIINRSLAFHVFVLRVFFRQWLFIGIEFFSRRGRISTTPLCVRNVCISRVRIVFVSCLKSVFPLDAAKSSLTMLAKSFRKTQRWEDIHDRMLLQKLSFSVLRLFTDISFDQYRKHGGSSLNCTRANLCIWWSINYIKSMLSIWHIGILLF